MATFFEGTRGSGKSKFAVERIQNRMKSGRAVATNLDLFLDHLWPENPKASYTRLPDFPRSKDLILLDKAYSELNPDDPKTYDDKKFGVVVLDELLTSFNSRSWNDPDRIEVVNWIVQSRKYGWDLCLIGQSIDGVDKQVRDTVISELYSFRSSLNMFPGMIWKMFVAPWFNKLVPKFHLCTQYDGRKKDKNTKTGVAHFRRNDLHACYKTGQQFKKDVRIVVNENAKKPIEIDDRATYTVLSPKYFDDAPDPTLEPVKDKPVDNPLAPIIQKQSSLTLLFGVLIFFAAAYYFASDWSKSLKLNSTPTTVKKSIVDTTVSDSLDSLDASDVGRIFINCFSYSTSGSFDYCFNNTDGQVVKPEYLGYKVLSVNDCHAKLYRKKTELDVYCNPVAIPSEKFDYGDKDI